MPIDYSKYPPDWKQIRQRILQRENNCCKECGLKNSLIVSRDNKLGLVKDLMNGPVWKYNDEGKLIRSEYSWHLSDWRSDHVAKVVLTIAHLDHDITNNEDENLAALCQRCHLKLDANQHKENSRKTRNNKKGLQSLF